VDCRDRSARSRRNQDRKAVGRDNGDAQARPSGDDRVRRGWIAATERFGAHHDRAVHLPRAEVIRRLGGAALAETVHDAERIE
jgi:hypothetical protein